MYINRYSNEWWPTITHSGKVQEISKCLNSQTKINLIAGRHILALFHSDTIIFQYSLVDTFNEDDDVDGDMWDYRKLFLDFSISYLGGFLEMHASQSSRFSQ